MYVVVLFVCTAILFLASYVGITKNIRYSIIKNNYYRYFYYGMHNIYLIESFGVLKGWESGIPQIKGDLAFVSAVALFLHRRGPLL